MKKFFKRFKWLIPLGVVVVGAITGIDLTPVQKAVEDSLNDSTSVNYKTNELGDSIVNDSIVFNTIKNEK